MFSVSLIKIKSCVVAVVNIESYAEGVDQKKRLDDLAHLAELCIEVLQQNDEYHAEVTVVLSLNLNCGALHIQ